DRRTATQGAHRVQHRTRPAVRHHPRHAERPTQSARTPPGASPLTTGHLRRASPPDFQVTGPAVVCPVPGGAASPGLGEATPRERCRTPPPTGVLARSLRAAPVPTFEVSEHHERAGPCASSRPPSGPPGRPRRPPP